MYSLLWNWCNNALAAHLVCCMYNVSVTHVYVCGPLCSSSAIPEYVIYIMFATVTCSSDAKSLKDDATLKSLNIKDGGALYFKDLGPQMGWRTVR